MDWKLVFDIIGWIGAALVLVAYALLSVRRLEGNSASYQLMNIQGGLCLLANTAYHRAYPSAFVNLIWVIIAGSALVYAMKTRQRNAESLKETAIPNCEPPENARHSPRT